LSALPKHLNLKRLGQPGLKSSDRPPALANQLERESAGAGGISINSDLHFSTLPMLV
jgi:hypothetical protein